jgi:predicted porin
MNRGFMKTTSWTALMAAGLLMGSYAFSPATAADLKGGDCCADLEERVAELEATTARKGNRVVSLTIYGQVSRGVLIWDDGTDSDAYVVENDASATRFGLKGEGQMKPGWKAGFNIELEVQDAASDEVSQLFDEVNDDFENASEDRGVSETIRTRLAYWYLNSERLGQLSVGHLSTASDAITEITLQNNAGKAIGSTALVKSFTVLNGSNPIDEGDADPTWGDISANLAGLGRNDIVRYDTPSLHGFILSASAGDNDLWDVALRYKGEWNSFRVAGGIAYGYDGTANDFEGEAFSYELIAGSASVMHIPTGLFAAVSAGEKDYSDDDTEDDATYWAVQLGVERKWLPYGATTFTAEYASYEGDFNSSSGLTFNGSSNGLFNASSADKWGVSVVQAFDSAALDIFAHYEHWEGDVPDAESVTEGGFSPDGELDVLMIGSRIRF